MNSAFLEHVKKKNKQALLERLIKKEIEEMENDN